ncbi:30S ribosomal protein S6 [Candidatus Phytoplasma luffae]|uniref:Small ribosomal subunit protein bS6 n=1 Tax=Loofah witches'-broom phytoplasma TaxID=35773 RepID=A0A975IM31_LOWBP|nr:30S ribosomal protein S6 [Candidatus Phytoplasma luffae]QTX02881.1 30S ribosomal protein S6 [Candidatus Phytoplasma luffae]QTX03020.1 30S ribosomal protein S6 [Candidatus Phytoplasma luffae]
MKTYEIMYILSPNLDEKQVNNIEKNINNIFDKEGKILEYKKPELKTLAYSIKKFTQGFYINFLVQADNEMIKEFNRIVNITEEIIRYIVLKKEDNKEL